MTPAARVQAAIELVDAILTSQASADTLIADWFRARRFAGSKDRRAIRDLVWRAVRAYAAPPPSGRAALAGIGEAQLFDGSPYGPAPLRPDEPVALPLPESERPGRAPLDLRVNTLKAERDAVGRLLGGDRIGAHGLRFAEPFPLETTPAYREGLVEVQDLGSQIVVEACRAEPGMTVLDLCAGAGGKTLALAAAMQNQGRLIACDVSRDRLSQLRPRSERAGARVEVRLLDGGREAEQLEDLSGKVDVVLVDAPCSGSGTVRRNPEQRWRQSPERLDRLIALQRHVLGLAAPLVKPGGALVYAVCSADGREGREQAERFLDRTGGLDATPLPWGRTDGPGVVLTPEHDGTDGFFIARSEKRC